MVQRKKKTKSERFRSINKEKLSGKLRGVFSNNPALSFNYKQLAKRLDIKDTSTKKLINTLLIELCEYGFLSEIHTGKYRLKSRAGFVTGIVDLTPNGSAYILADEFPVKIFVAQANLNHALHGDKVKVYLYAKRKSRRFEGEVVEILERSKKVFVGIVSISTHFAFLIPVNKQMPYDIFIPLNKLNNAENGQKAIAKIIDWPQGVKNPIGEIIEVLGKPGDNEVEMHAILAEFELPLRFPEKVLEAAGKINRTITPADYRERRDFRKISTFTIDPEDAKDFDDALSIRKLKSGNWEVGVHIADVTYYINENSILDKEACKRATSVYLVDRVVPMLPEHLSNNICSLRPHENRLCYSVVFELDDQANVLKEWFGRTIICSNKRFTYEEAQRIIETGKGELKDEIIRLNQLAQILRQQRLINGSLDIERIEVKFDIDEKGTPLGILFKENKKSNQLIEEFMLLANRKVAEFIGGKTREKPKVFVYRIHDKPNQEKLHSFIYVIKKFGYRIDTSTHKKLCNSINKLLKDVQGKREQNLVETLALRSMAKAKYSIKNIGHYGLAFSHYTHFTSPIRRYPDIMVHRLLDSYLNKEASKDEKKYKTLCNHSSEMELRAIEAERASIKYKQVEFLADKVGRQFDGIITGVADWGIYIEISENKCEGLVPIRDLDDDFYELDEGNFCITGRYSYKRYQLGDPARVEIIRINLPKKQVDLKLVE
jgi:ribonuclease R